MCSSNPAASGGRESTQSALKHPGRKRCWEERWSGAELGENSEVSFLSKRLKSWQELGAFLIHCSAPSYIWEKSDVSREGCDDPAEPESVARPSGWWMECPAGPPAAQVVSPPIHLPPHSSHQDLSKTPARSCQSRLNPFRVPH